jgi:hypothetical protein
VIQFRSLRVRMIVFLVALLGAVQVAEFVLTNHASYNAARGKIEDELGVGQKVFARVLRQNAEREAQAAGASASDFAFREARPPVTSPRSPRRSTISAHASRPRRCCTSILRAT